MPVIPTIINDLYKYYPRGISLYEEGYNRTPEHQRLLQKLEAARLDRRWQQFMQELNELHGYSVQDTNIFAFPIPCFKANVYFTKADKDYEVVFYVSILLPFYAFRLKELLRSAYRDKSVMNMPRSEAPAFLAQLRAEQEAFNASHPPIFNQAPDEVAPEINKLVAIQNHTFVYPPLPVDLVKEPLLDIATNEKDLGEATIFDAVFTSSRF
jgi:hypothetical protein